MPTAEVVTKSKTKTNADVLEHCNSRTHEIAHLDMEVPFLSEPQAQGDVVVLPVEPVADRGTAVPAAGVTIVRGETAGRNAHMLHAMDGSVYWQPKNSSEATDLVQGWLTVPEGSTATLIHTQEHNVLGIAPGCYEIRREREFAGEWRRIAD